MNKYINIKLKYEYLENIGALDEVQYKGKKITVAEGIMSTEVNGIPLFVGIE